MVERLDRLFGPAGLNIGKGQEVPALRAVVDGTAEGECLFQKGNRRLRSFVFQRYPTEELERQRRGVDAQ